MSGRFMSLERLGDVLRRRDKAIIRAQLAMSELRWCEWELNSHRIPDWLAGPSLFDHDAIRNWTPDPRLLEDPAETPGPPAAAGGAVGEEG